MDQYLGEIRLFAGMYAPRDWTFCDGQVMAIAGNEALFSLLGTSYGGDGRSSFGLPDLRGRVPVHFGSGPRLTPRAIGAKFGVENVTLTLDQIPSHNHPMQASTDYADSVDPTERVLGKMLDANELFYGPYQTDKEVEFLDTAVSTSGNSSAHENMQPYLVLNFIIALKGEYPQRN